MLKTGQGVELSVEGVSEKARMSVGFGKLVSDKWWVGCRIGKVLLVLSKVWECRDGVKNLPTLGSKLNGFALLTVPISFHNCHILDMLLM